MVLYMYVCRHMYAMIYGIVCDNVYMSVSELFDVSACLVMLETTYALIDVIVCVSVCVLVHTIVHASSIVSPYAIVYTSVHVMVNPFVYVFV